MSGPHRESRNNFVIRVVSIMTRSECEDALRSLDDVNAPKTAFIDNASIGDLREAIVFRLAPISFAYGDMLEVMREFITRKARLAG